ncbi:hypothetical protein FRZ03_15800 [Streptomyces misionensis]|uniref:DUF6801 domain-containing protein n=1 Tax=Streptomyces misionensis TaxID=67331 RepID=A0A5C6JUZ1_9ACTN|nr:DUF6801 domain-containing protein [Streptomyces misionensis]TWV46061.1 hypothetical protein FRZ03_15800 [Streptomyces misionensis]
MTFLEKKGRPDEESGTTRGHRSGRAVRRAAWLTAPLTLACAAAGSAIGGLGAGAAAADPASITQQYTCALPYVGDRVVTFRLNSAVPDNVLAGKPSPAFPIVADAPVSPSDTTWLRRFGFSSIEGTVVAKVAVLALGVDINRDVPFAVPRTTVPASGSLDAEGTGTAPQLVFKKPGIAKITTTQLILHIVPRDANGNVVSPPGSFSAPCTLNHGENDVVATVRIAAPEQPTGPGKPGGTGGSGTGSGSGSTAPSGTAGPIPKPGDSSGATATGATGGASPSASSPGGQSTTPAASDSGATSLSPAANTSAGRSQATATSGPWSARNMLLLSAGLLLVAAGAGTVFLRLRARRR